MSKPRRILTPMKSLNFRGVFLVATGDEKDEIDLEETVSCMMTWINNSDVFEYGDFPQCGMCQILTAQ